MTDPRDVRLRGFVDRVSLSAAWTWLDALVRPPPEPEVVHLAQATGRVLAEAIVNHAGPEDPIRAASNGYAVRAADCDGANAYNPLRLAWCQPGAALLPPGTACPIAAGWPLPVGADTVLPFDAAERISLPPHAAEGLEATGPDWVGLDVMAPVAPGVGINRHAQALPVGMPVLPNGQRLLPHHIACLAGLGVMTVSVLPRPRVRLFVPGPKSGPDMLTPMLHALLARDGARVEAVRLSGADEPELAAALARPASGLVLIAGRSGTGPDDVAPAAVRAAGGDLPLHGLALNPGGSAALGTLFDEPVILLPGEPYACLAAYDMLVAFLVRRLAGYNTTLPYAAVPLDLERKIVSGIGLTEIVPVRTTPGRAQPISAESGLGAMLADGFIIIPETSEGYPAGSSVKVYLYDLAGSGSEIEGP